MGQICGIITLFQWIKCAGNPISPYFILLLRIVIIINVVQQNYPKIFRNSCTYSYLFQSFWNSRAMESKIGIIGDDFMTWRKNNFLTGGWRWGRNCPTFFQSNVNIIWTDQAFRRNIGQKDIRVCWMENGVAVLRCISQEIIWCTETIICLNKLKKILKY